jgi:hypothetical protein
MAQRYKTTPEKFVQALAAVRDTEDTSCFGICEALFDLYAYGLIDRVTYYAVELWLTNRLFPPLRKVLRPHRFTYNGYLYVPGNWKPRVRLLNMIIDEICHKYHIVHP